MRPSICNLKPLCHFGAVKVFAIIYQLPELGRVSTKDDFVCSPIKKPRFVCNLEPCHCATLLSE